MIKIIITFLIILSPSLITAQWEQTNGPYGGTPRCFAVDGSNVFMGTNYNGGFYSSTNGGVSWNRLNNSLSEYDFFSLIFKESSLFAGTRFGIYKSTNNGMNWNLSGLSTQFIWSLAVSGNNIFAGTSGSGIYLSTNNGSNWNAVNNGLSNLDVRTISISGTNIYAGTFGGGVFKSTNNGNNWSSINNGITNLTILTFAISGSNIFVGTQGNLGGVFKSTNNGINWSIANTGLLNTNIYALTVSQGNLFAGTQGGGLYKSTNSGINWFYSNSGLTSAYVWSFATSGNNLIAGCFDAGGCFYSTNNGSNWLSANNGLLNQNVTSLEVFNTNIFAGTNRDGIFKSTNNGISWEKSSNGLPNTFIYSLKNFGSTIFAGTSGLGGIYKSIDNGLNWIVSNTGLTNQTVLILQTIGSNIFAGTYGGGLFLSTNNGSEWISANNGITNNNIWDLTSLGTSIFCATENGIFRSTNDGTTWITVNNGLNNTNVRSITSSGKNIIAGTYGSGIFLSSNNGNNWSLVNAGIPYVWSFNTSGSNIFAGTQTGVYLSTNNGLVWSNYNQSFPSRIINSLLVAKNFVFAGTQGSSVLRRSISGTIASVNYPTPYAKLISGEQDTITWAGLIWEAINIKCIFNVGTAQQSIVTLANNYPNSQQYIWDIPDTLSFRSKIVIENAANPTLKIESDIFRIKPYLLTRVNPDSIYYEYRKNRDQWGFWNHPEQMWPELWYNQFNYRFGNDPFTNQHYSLIQGHGAFLFAKRSDHPDWISMVNTFTINRCYKNINEAIYSEGALGRWKKIKKSWDGSCFGIAIANSLVFSNKNDFFIRYPSFPSFDIPGEVETSDPVKKIINELYTHQFIDEHWEFKRNAKLNKTTNETLEDIKNMLIADNDPQRILAFERNKGKGGHAVNVISVKQDNLFPNIYRVQIYDNLNPDLFSFVIVDTDANNGKGHWTYPLIDFMSGDSLFYLMDSSLLYLNTLSDNNNFNSTSNGNLIQIFNQAHQDIMIYDNLGNRSGISNDTTYMEIPGSTSETILNGVEIPPYSYLFYSDNYKVSLNNFKNDTVSFGLDANNKSFSYERQNAQLFQTDNLYFDGALSVSNPDTSVKSIYLSSILDETTQEKVYAFTSIDLAQNDSVKIENLGTENFKLISYGSSKSYDIELTFVSQIQLGRFLNVNIALPPNSSHTFITDWNNVTTSQLVILEDVGNNGTIDDTLRVINIITNTGEEFVSALDKYSLSQNYPNPFNPSTLIKYDIKKDGFVSLKVYNILGKEVVSLVNEVKQTGRYEAEFNGSNLSSGIYYYRLVSGEFSETKKMLLLK